MTKNKFSHHPFGKNYEINMDWSCYNYLPISVWYNGPGGEKSRLSKFSMNKKKAKALSQIIGAWIKQNAAPKMEKK
jgi:hypothetical protein